MGYNTFVSTSDHTLLALPVELVEEILGLLHPLTIFHVRQTCRLLYSATKSRSLWYRLVRGLQAHPSIARIEEPVSDYTVEELESWVFHRHRVRATWSSSRGARLQKRSIEYPARYPFLIPGGRWLLSMHGNSPVLVATDLDAGQLEPDILCKDESFSKKTQLVNHSHCFTTWIDATQPRLTFRVAIFRVTIPQDAKPAAASTTIYEVKLNGHGSNAKLVSEKLLVLQPVVPGKSHSESLDHRYFIQVKGINQNGEMNEHSVIHVFRYDATTGSNLPPISMRMDNKGALDLCILPNDRLAVTRCAEIAIYKIPEEAPDPRLESRLPAMYTIPLAISWPETLLSFRTPFYFGTKSTFTVYLDSENQLSLLAIPHDPSKEPYRSQPTPSPLFTGWSNLAVGFSHSIAINNQGYWEPSIRFDVVAYALELEQVNNSLSEFPPIQLRQFQFQGEGRWLPGIQGFDEGKGRLVCGGRSGAVLEIYDFV